MAKANVSMDKEVMGLELEKRHINLVDVDESLIKSGDFILIMRLDGIDPIIMYGTGSHGAHCGVLIWFPEPDGTEALYIIESQDAWYWPTKNIQRTPFKKWISQAQDASFNVIWLPLKEEAADRFDRDSAIQWF